jgi:LCP family protein required for cell wall assembly
MSALRLSPRRHAPHGRGHPGLRFLAYSVAAILGFSSVGSYVYLQSALDVVHKVDVTVLLGDHRPVAPVPPADSSVGQPVNILLMGSDSRVGANAALGGADGGMRNDTTIVMHISADRSRIEFMSIPRDSWVRTSDCVLFDGKVNKGWTGKFNVAFYNGGRTNNNPAEAAACVQRTVEDLTGIYIDYYAVVDFVGFEGMVNALGGVPMCIPGHIVSPNAQLDIQGGPQVLDGRTALAWARAREATVGRQWLDGSDTGRITRQQTLLAHTAEKAMSENIFLDQGKLRAFITAGASSMTTSPRLADAPFLVGLAFSLRKISPKNIVFTTVPFKADPVESGSVLWTAAASTMFSDIKNDRPIAGRSVADASTAAPAPAATPGTGGTTATPGAPAAAPSPSIDLLGACAPA